MYTGRFLKWTTVAGLLVIAACAPTPAASDATLGTNAPLSGVSVDFDSKQGASRPATATITSTSGALTVSSNSTPGAEVNLPPSNTVGSEPGASEPATAVATGKTLPATGTPGSAASKPSGAWLFYVNDTYKFRVNYPPDYPLRSQSAKKMAQLEPAPVAAWIFLSPEKVSSDIADLEPPDLEVRVYDAAETTSLENWLTSVGLLSVNGDMSSKAFQTSNVSGLQLCASTMIFPGCSNFVLGKSRVYQLITTSQVGEEMLKTFTLIPDVKSSLESPPSL